MPGDAWITLAIVLAMLVALARDLAPPSAIVLGATVTLLVIGVIDEEQAFAGFSNSAPLTVAALYVLARAAEKTGLMSPLVNRVLGTGQRTGRAALGRLVVPTAGISGFVNNTPLVAMLIPEITAWCSRRGISPSRLLLPLSYAAILGGTITVIGTSTNLVVSGLLEESGQDPLGLFEITKIGGPVALAGLVALLIFVPILLPERRAPGQSLGEGMREFVVEMEVETGGKLDRTSVEEAGLRHLEGVYLVELIRGDRPLAAVGPSTILEGGDGLIFVGQADLIVDLQRTPGLRSSQEEHLLAIDTPQHTFYEAVIGAGSPLAGQSLAESDFRARYQAAVVAIHRSGSRVEGKLGELRLRPGDTLLFLAGPDFRARWRRRSDFLLVARLGGPPPSSSRQAPLVGFTALAMIVLATLEVLPILQLALLAGAAMVLSRVLTFSEARNAVDLDVIILIAAAFGVGAAVETTGLAANAADALVDGLGPLGDVGIILGLMLATTLLTEMITNNAAAVVLFPIAISIAAAASLDPRVVAMAVAVAASTSFLSPLGYQTNTMVYGPGGYRFSDYLRVGIPINLTAVAVITATTAVYA